MNRRYRKTVIAGNWKMNKTVPETKAFIGEIRQLASQAKWCEVVLCVPFTHLHSAVKAAKGTRIDIGAQNCHFEEHGAYTGEVSCSMLAELGVKYVIIGHSERREYFAENNITVGLKLKAALKAGLRPILCIGESLELREMDATFEHVRMQLKAALSGIAADSLRKITIAYEPIWAIGTGKTATAAQANEVCEEIRHCLRQMYGARAARGVSILYGGSMNEKNSDELLSMPDVDGGLIGGASLKAESFKAIIEVADQ